MSNAATRKISTLIVDDEPLARRNIALLLRRHPEIEIVGECGSGTEALAAIHQLGPDLLFLDLQIPSMSGFDVIRSLSGSALPWIVVLTEYDPASSQSWKPRRLSIY